ncbi:FG-GAP repeat protein [Photobacterium kasasachensis]|uniref:FG-GAP repeat protein n=1 Tax=Photobacterium kasasachensis TaxID=2910240 RepID=UPI003D0D1F42
MKLTKFIPLLVTTALLSACGGGGGSSATPGGGDSEVTPETRTVVFSIENLSSETQQENVPFTPQTATTAGDRPVGKLSWTVDDDNNWTISAEGVLTYIGELDFETIPNTHTVKVTAADENGNSATKSVTITLTDVVDEDEPSSDTNLIVNASFKMKTFIFQWSSVEKATRYQLCLKDITKPNNCEPLGDATSSLTAEYTAPSLIDVESQVFFVMPQNDNGFTLSNEVTVSKSDISAAIGYLKASNADVKDWFGWRVSLSEDGNTLAVGAYLEDSNTTGINSTPNKLASYSGAVYVFTRSETKWEQEAYIKASNTDSDDFFAYSISLSADGNRLAVGAPKEDSGKHDIPSDNTKTNSGAAYIFTRVGRTWSQSAYIKASNSDVEDLFGMSLSLSADGSTLAVGSGWEDSSTTGINSTPNNDASSAGAVYVFTYSGTKWEQEAYIKASNTQNRDFFGDSVSISANGDTLAVGAMYEDSGTTGVNSIPNEAIGASGAVYVFQRTGTVWAQQAYIKASNPGENDWFGGDVTISGDGNTLAVGATWEDSNTTGINSTPNDAGHNAGAVYVYVRTGDDWVQQAFVKAHNTEDSDWFGRAVALSGDGNTLAVGADLEDSSTTGINSNPDNLTEDAGAVYVYKRVGNLWSGKAYIKPTVIRPYDKFGQSVSLSSDGNTLAVGAYHENSSSTGVNSLPDDNAADAGAVYVY